MGPLRLLGRLLAAVFKKRGTASRRGTARPAGRGNTRPGVKHAPNPAMRKARERQKARRRGGPSGGVAAAPAPKKAPRPRRGEHPITALQRTGATGVPVRGQAVVFRVLPDDLEGSRHQRFLVKLADGHVVKISHNIDLAERVPAREGDVLRFAGDFASNELGGAVHWTHLDPRDRHPHGWIEHRGKRYE